MAETEAAIAAATDPKNFPRWAQACPKSFDLLQRSLADAVVLTLQAGLTREQQDGVTRAIAHVASVCWAAGRASVKEGRENGLGDELG
jgi:hypothetical protein